MCFSFAWRSVYRHWGEVHFARCPLIGVHSTPLLDYTIINDNGDTERLQQVFVTDGKRTAYVLTLHTYAEDAAAFRDQVMAMVYSFSI